MKLDLKHIIIYTDGSGINSKIEALAVAPRLGLTQAITMGSDQSAIVYTVKLKGIKLVIDIIFQQVERQ